MKKSAYWCFFKKNLKWEPKNPAGDRMYMCWSQYSEYWNHSETLRGRNRTLLFLPQRVSLKFMERKHALMPCCLQNFVTSCYFKFPFKVKETSFDWWIHSSLKKNEHGIWTLETSFKGYTTTLQLMKDDWLTMGWLS